MASEINPAAYADGMIVVQAEKNSNRKAEMYCGSRLLQRGQLDVGKPFCYDLAAPDRCIGEYSILCTASDSDPGRYACAAQKYGTEV